MIKEQPITAAKVDLAYMHKGKKIPKLFGYVAKEKYFEEIMPRTVLKLIDEIIASGSIKPDKIKVWARIRAQIDINFK